MLPNSRDGYAVVVLAYPQFYCVGSQRCAVGYGSHPSHTFHIDSVDDLAGFFLGPLFPGIVVCLTRLLPKSMQVSAIGICSAVGASGASIVPFAVGAIAQAKGVKVLQPIIFACLVLCLLLWFCIEKLPR